MVQRHIAVVVDGESRQLYLDGQPVDRIEGARYWFEPQHNPGSTQWWDPLDRSTLDGEVSEVRLNGELLPVLEDADAP